MALFGNTGRRTPLFPAEDFEPTQLPTTQPLPSQIPAQHGFGRPSTLQTIAGTIGDALQQYSGGQGTFLPQLAQQRQMQMAEQQYRRRRSDALEDWKAQQMFKLANPEPINNDTIADYQFRAQTLGKEAADDWLRSASDPVVTVTLPGNRVYSGPRSGLATALGGGMAPVQRPAIGTELPDPRRKGGAPSQGGATFP